MLDIDESSHVINDSVPNEPETYVHRIGRTGLVACPVDNSPVRTKQILAPRDDRPKSRGRKVADRYTKPGEPMVNRACVMAPPAGASWARTKPA